MNWMELARSEIAWGSGDLQKGQGREQIADRVCGVEQRKTRLGTLVVARGEKLEKML